MSLQWTRALSTGLEWQDDEHKRIFQWMSELLEAMNRSQASTVMNDLVIFMEKYATDHFQHEEQFMIEQNDPGLEAHKAEHAKFAAKAQEFKTIYARQGASSYLTMQVQRWLRDWLLEHIAQTDKKMGVWMREKAVHA
jgi:hemerythrin